MIFNQASNRTLVQDRLDLVLGNGSLFVFPDTKEPKKRISGHGQNHNKWLGYLRENKHWGSHHSCNLLWVGLADSLRDQLPYGNCDKGNQQNNKHCCRNVSYTIWDANALKPNCQRLSEYGFSDDSAKQTNRSNSNLNCGKKLGWVFADANCYLSRFLATRGHSGKLGSL